MIQRKPISREFLMTVFERLGPQFLSTSAQHLSDYGYDRTHNLVPCVSAVAFPKETKEVSAFLKLCHAFSVPVVPSGGRTGLAGGAVPTQGEVVLSLDRLNRFGDLDPKAGVIRVGAGVITQTLQDYCEPHGLMWPVRFSASGSSHVGGNLATNAGGVWVVRYGTARHWVIGLEVVTMQGDVLKLGGDTEKNAVGPDLMHLFLGSEGTLGVITEATLKLAAVPKNVQVLLVVVDGIRGGVELLKRSRFCSAFDLLAFEYLSHDCLKLVIQESGIPVNLDRHAKGYVLMAAVPRRETQWNQWLDHVLNTQTVCDGIMGYSVSRQQELWRIREMVPECLSRRVVHKMDVAVPIPSLPVLEDEMSRLLDSHCLGCDVFVFGHLGDGNLHINIAKPTSKNPVDFKRMVQVFEDMLWKVVQQLNGSVSAEHGIGLLKKHAFVMMKSESQRVLLSEIKRVLDPKCLLNPGKVFDVSPTSEISRTN